MTSRFNNAERNLQEGKPELALKALYAEWAVADKNDEARLVQFLRRAEMIRENTLGGDRDSAEKFLLTIHRHLDGEGPGEEGPHAGGTSAHSEAHSWVAACVWILAIASVLSVLAGIIGFLGLIGSAAIYALAFLFAGAVLAALYLGAALALQLLSEAAQDLRRLANQPASQARR